MRFQHGGGLGQLVELTDATRLVRMRQELRDVSSPLDYGRQRTSVIGKLVALRRAPLELEHHQKENDDEATKHLAAFYEAWMTCRTHVPLGPSSIALDNFTCAHCTHGLALDLGSGKCAAGDARGRSRHPVANRTNALGLRAESCITVGDHFATILAQYPMRGMLGIALFAGSRVKFACGERKRRGCQQGNGEAGTESESAKLGHDVSFS